jgi:acetyl esterase
VPLTPETRRVLAAYHRRGTPSTAEEARRLYGLDPDFAGPPEPVADVWDDRVPVAGGSVPVRVYVPMPGRPSHGDPDGRRLLPVVVYFHGGGWVCGGIPFVDSPLRAIANRAGCVVASVDYRLAPEHRFPTAAEDAYAATCWVAERAPEIGLDASRITVAGDSAGGNLAAVVSLMARERGSPRIAYQVLVYPVTDYRFDTASYIDNAQGYLLTRESMKWYWAQYLADPGDGANPYASPLRADLHDLPPASVLTAEFDPLRDEGRAFADSLERAGVAVTHRCYRGLVHGFFRMASAVPEARAALADIAGDLRAALGR